MTSTDNYVTIEIFNAGIQGIKTEMNQRFDIIQTEIKEMNQELRITQNDVAHIQTSIYWGFAVMGIVIALVGLIVAILAIIPPERSEDLSSRNIRDIRALIREEFSMLNSLNLDRRN
ncbi:MAG: hypothetical protein IJ859_00215 [Synergistaceae bacterium]|nr:hypothetical protein [Synergistaceae bacterium]